MPDFRANITSNYDNYDDRYQQLGEDAPKEKPSLPKDEEIQKAMTPFLHQFAAELNELNIGKLSSDHRMQLLDKDRMVDDLKAFRDHLQSLIEKNHSHDSDFILKISIVWNHILEISNFVKMIDLKKEINMDLLQKLIESLEHYPEYGDFSLSYYMTNFPGQQWHPFPLMEIFQQLHEEVQNDTTSGRLREWIATLNQIIP